jgi:hypothetical protein
VAATAALLFTLGQIGLFARGYYAPTARMAFPSPHDKALAGVVSRVPPDIPVAADDPFLAHLAHRRYAYYYGYMSGAVLAAPPEALILERRHHPPADLPLLAKDARAWGLTLAAVDGDHAYLRRGPAKATWADLFRKWYGTLEEWQCSPPEPDRSIRDPLAHDGRALPPAREIYCDPGPRYVFPAGEYNLAFVLRAAGGKAARANLSATAVSVENHEQKKTAVATAALAAGAPYTSTNVHLKFERPFSLTFFIGADNPIYYDAVSINGPAYTFKNVAKTAVQVNLGLIPAY